jgi:predicted transcriptional regulator/DNA-binding CsgD family transcriptional regulator
LKSVAHRRNARRVGILDELGVTERQQVVYEALVERPGAGLDQLAKRAGLGRDAVARTLSQLQQRGLAIRAPGREAHYTAVAPALVFDTLLRRRVERLDEVRRTIAVLGERHETASRLDGAQEMVEVVHGDDAVHRRWLQLQRSARSVIRGFDKPPYIDRGNPAAERGMLQRGIAYRTVYDRTALDLPGKLAGIWEAHDAGEDCRVAADVPLKLFIADERMALAPLRESGDIESAIVVHASALLSALVALFESVWARAVPIRDHRAETGGRALTELQGRLLDLLDVGLTDEAIARHLGLGYRTVQRRISELMELYGAQTRFQLGVQASREAARVGPER